MERQTFTKLYTELANLIGQIDAIKWIDLWNSQVYHLQEEHPFPAPAVFLAFRSNTISDLSEKTQNLHTQVDVFVFWETFADSYKGSFNQGDAIKFLELLDNINKILHGSSGEQYSSMRRVAFSPVDTGGAGNLWSITYSCELIDSGAAIEWETTTGKDVVVEDYTIDGLS